jgi:5-(hydroxymethyl)furfural/furfural oxidase
MQPRALRPAANMALRLTPEGGEAGDIYIGVANKTSWHALGHRLGGLIVSVFRPLSRGAVRLVPGPQGPRAVSDFAMLTDPRDMTRMVWAWRTACGLVTAPEAAAAVLEAFPAAFSDRVRALNRSGLRNRLAAAALARALDLPAPLRRRLVARMCEGGHPLSALMVDDAALQDALRRTVTGFYHPAGTCRMGAANDPFAVVDPAGRVHRVPGLRVVDASIMPQIPRGNTNVPVLMIAEKIAQGWRDD